MTTQVATPNSMPLPIPALSGTLCLPNDENAQVVQYTADIRTIWKKIGISDVNKNKNLCLVKFVPVVNDYFQILVAYVDAHRQITPEHIKLAKFNPVIAHAVLAAKIKGWGTHAITYEQCVAMLNLVTREYKALMYGLQTIYKPLMQTMQQLLEFPRNVCTIVRPKFLPGRAGSIQKSAFGIIAGMIGKILAAVDKTEHDAVVNFLARGNVARIVTIENLDIWLANSVNLALVVATSPSSMFHPYTANLVSSFLRTVAGTYYQSIGRGNVYLWSDEIHSRVRTVLLYGIRAVVQFLVDQVHDYAYVAETGGGGGGDACLISAVPTGRAYVPYLLTMPMLVSYHIIVTHGDYTPRFGQFLDLLETHIKAASKYMCAIPAAAAHTIPVLPVDSSVNSAATIKALQETVAKMAASINVVETTFADHLKTVHGNLKETVDKHQTALDALASNYNDAGSKLASFAARVRQFETKLDEITTKIATVFPKSGNVEEYATVANINELKIEHNTRIDDLQRLITEVKTSLATVHTTIDTKLNSKSAPDAATAAVPPPLPVQDFATMAQLNRLEQQIAQLSTKMDTYETKFGNIVQHADIETKINEHTSVYDTRIKDLETNLAANTAKVAEVDKAHATLQQTHIQDVADLSKKIDTATAAAATATATATATAASMVASGSGTVDADAKAVATHKATLVDVLNRVSKIEDIAQKVPVLETKVSNAINVANDAQTKANGIAQLKQEIGIGKDKDIKHDNAIAALETSVKTASDNTRTLETKFETVKTAVASAGSATNASTTIAVTKNAEDVKALTERVDAIGNTAKNAHAKAIEVDKLRDQHINDNADLKKKIDAVNDTVKTATQDASDVKAKITKLDDFLATTAKRTDLDALREQHKTDKAELEKKIVGVQTKANDVDKLREQHNTDKAELEKKIGIVTTAATTGTNTAAATAALAALAGRVTTAESILTTHATNIDKAVAVAKDAHAKAIEVDKLREQHDKDNVKITKLNEFLAATAKKTDLNALKEQHDKDMITIPGKIAAAVAADPKIASAQDLKNLETRVGHTEKTASTHATEIQTLKTNVSDATKDRITIKEVHAKDKKVTDDEHQRLVSEFNKLDALFKNISVPIPAPVASPDYTNDINTTSNNIIKELTVRIKKYLPTRLHSLYDGMMGNPPERTPTAELIENDLFADFTEIVGVDTLLENFDPAIRLLNDFGPIIRKPLREAKYAPGRLAKIQGQIVSLFETKTNENLEEKHARAVILVKTVVAWVLAYRANDESIFPKAYEMLFDKAPAQLQSRQPQPQPQPRQPINASMDSFTAAPFINKAPVRMSMDPQPTPVRHTARDTVDVASLDACLKILQRDHGVVCNAKTWSVALPSDLKSNLVRFATKLDHDYNHLCTRAGIDTPNSVDKSAVSTTLTTSTPFIEIRALRENHGMEYDAIKAYLETFRSKTTEQLRDIFIVAHALMTRRTLFQ